MPFLKSILNLKQNFHDINFEKKSHYIFLTDQIELTQKCRI
jgi:hypothetical protein